MNELQKINNLPVPAASIDAAVKSFVSESDQYHVPHDKRGLYNATLESMAACLTNKADDSRHLWLAWEGGKVLAYVLCHITKDVDGSLCYYMTQAWVAPELRRSAAVKSWYQKLREEAKQKLCKHIVVPSSRNTEAYLRFLGKGWHVYCTLLKEDI